MKNEDVKGHVVFDCDGTLVSSTQMVFDTVAKVLTEHLGKPVSSDEVKDNFDADIDLMYAKYGIKTDAEKHEIQKRWKDLARQYPHKYKLFPGVRELLEKLKEANYALYVWTARDKASTFDILKDQQIDHFFWDIRTGTCTSMKPNPQGLEELIGHLDPKTVFHIGDSYTDIMGAKAVRCLSIGVLWCDHVDEKSLKDQGADYFADDPANVLEIIEGYFSSES
jgi:phosphoglycolate phosphatase